MLPFTDRLLETACSSPDAAALTDGVAGGLAALRSLFVIANDSRAALQADYTVKGVLRSDGECVSLAVELVEVRSARIAWAEAFTLKTDCARFSGTCSHVVAAIASQVEMLERNQAVLRPSASLSAWQSYHRALWHMYRFSREENARALQLFQASVRLDPTFSRAHGGESFAHFQDAFHGWKERRPAVGRAIESAGRSVMADERDPAAHWSLGRALWLEGSPEAALPELERAVHLSPDFAAGHYALAFVHAQSGDPQAAVAAADLSRELNPGDPMLLCVMAARAMALVRLGRVEEAAQWGAQAAAQPNAHDHVHVRAIATYCLALAGKLEAANAHAACLRVSQPRYGIDDFFGAFRFDRDGAARFRRGARLVGMA